MASLRSGRHSSSSGSLQAAHLVLGRGSAVGRHCGPGETRRGRNRSRIHRRGEQDAISSAPVAGTAVNAAALQQHFMRSVSLAVPNFALRGSRNIVKENARNVGRRRGQRQRASGAAASIPTARRSRNSASAGSTASSIQDELHHATRPWTCARCPSTARATPCAHVGNSVVNQSLRQAATGPSVLLHKSTILTRL